MSDVQIAVIDQQDTQIVLAVPGVQGATGSSIPAGGTAEQVLRKNSSTDYDANWSQVTSAMIANGTIINEDVNNSAAIAGTKISPDFGGQTVTTTGQVNAGRLNVTSNTIPSNGVYLPSANNVAISTNGTGRLLVDDNGRIGIGVSPNTRFQVANETTTEWSSGLSLSGSTNLNIVATTLNNPDTSITGPETFLNILAGGSGAAVHSIGVKRTGTGTGDLIFRRNVSGGSAESLRIDTSGRLGLGTSSPYSLLSTQPSSGTSITYNDFNGDGLLIQNQNQTNAANSYGGAVSWSRSGSGSIRKAAIASVQTTADQDPTGLAFLVSSSTSTSGNLFEALRIDSSGNVGVGTTSPSAILHVREDSATSSILRLENREASGGVATQAFSIQGVFDYNNGASAANGGRIVFGKEDTYTTSTSAIDSYLAFQTVENNTQSEKARIDSSGRLLVGTSSSTNVGSSVGAYIQTRFSASAVALSAVRESGNPIIALGRANGSAAQIVAADQALGEIRFAGADGTDLESSAASIACEVDGTPGSNDMPGRLVFSTNPGSPATAPVERMMITSTGQIIGVTGTNHILASESASSSTDTLIAFRHSATSLTSTGTNALIIRTNGDARNIGGIYTTLTSDERFKQDIVELGPQWNDIKGISLKKFRYKNDPTGELQLGVIAQELQQVCPGLVTTRTATEEDVDASGGLVAEGDEVLGWKMSILPLKAVKALQEAMERIETLEAKVAALEAQ